MFDLEKFINKMKLLGVDIVKLPCHINPKSYETSPEWTVTDFKGNKYDVSYSVSQVLDSNFFMVVIECDENAYFMDEIRLKEYNDYLFKNYDIITKIEILHYYHYMEQ